MIIVCIVCQKQMEGRSDKKFCSSCYKRHHNEKQREYNKEDKAAARYYRYRNTDKYRLYSKTRYKNLDNNKKRARYYLINAVRDGKLIRPKNCEQCGIKDWGKKRSMIEGHHYLGYEPQNWLKVKWLCTICHKIADNFIGGGELRET